MFRKQFRKLIAGGVVTGALTLGVVGGVGAVGASTSSLGAAGRGDPAASASAPIPCSHVSKLKAKLSAYERTAVAHLSKEEASEQQAKKAGHTKKADAIAAQITHVRHHHARLSDHLSKAEAACKTPGSSGAA